MKTLKITLLIALTFMVSMSFASKTVKSKLGDIDLMATQGGDKVLCTMGFNDEMTLIREAATEALVKGDCTGWVQKSKIEYVAKPEGNKDLSMGDVNVQAWIDNNTLVGVFDDIIEDDMDVEINRDFKEYLTYTIDREQTEMSHGEN